MSKHRIFAVAVAQKQVGVGFKPAPTKIQRAVQSIALLSGIPRRVADSQPLPGAERSEEHTSELQSHVNLVCRLLLEKKKTKRFAPLSRKAKAMSCDPS